MTIIGQDHILHYLNSAITSLTLHPSLLFVGPDGVGKKKVALEVVVPALTQGHVADCLVINRQFQASFLKEKIESQTGIKIELIRMIDNFLHLKSLTGGPRVAVIEEANRLTNEAANALLKLLEEPPDKAQLILLSNDEQCLPPTVVSRCAVLRFRLIAALELARWLVREKGVSIDEAEMIAERSNGSFANALSHLDNNDSDKNALPSLSSLNRQQFFSALEESAFRKDPRLKARQLIDHLIRQSQKKILKGELFEANIIQALLDAQRQIDHHVPPRLVLENLYLNYEKILSDNTTLLR